MKNSSKFKYRVVFFKQPSCAACEAMHPVWVNVANSIEEEFPHLLIGFGEFDVTSDNWDFCDRIECDGTPNFAIFNEEGSLLSLNTDGIVPETQLKNFIIGTIESL
jgi:hypothetical protein